MPSTDPAPTGVRPTKTLVVLVGLGTLYPAVSAGAALLAGIVIALALGNPYPEQSRSLAKRMLTWSVIGLGAGMDLGVVARVGAHGIGYTAVGISAGLVFGTLLGRTLGVNRDTSLLVTVGTSICGGSAIAAVAPVIGAKNEDVSMSLATVFLLNAIALFAFPPIGHRLSLGQDAFGLWCALAIHDTSSVVGAASQYGARALEVATATKLARALWIVPLTFAIAFVRARQATRAGRAEKATPSKPPWFIAGFLGVAALVTFVPQLQAFGHRVAFVAHRVLATTLFLIGLGLSRAALRSLGARPIAQATLLWLMLGGGTLFAIVRGWIG